MALDCRLYRRIQHLLKSVQMTVTARAPLSPKVMPDNTAVQIFWAYAWPSHLDFARTADAELLRPHLFATREEQSHCFALLIAPLTPNKEEAAACIPLCLLSRTHQTARALDAWCPDGRDHGRRGRMLRPGSTSPAALGLDYQRSRPRLHLQGPKCQEGM